MKYGISFEFCFDISMNMGLRGIQTQKSKHEVSYWTVQFFLIFIGLSFERPYLIKRLNLMIAKSVDFGKNCGFWSTVHFKKMQISQILKNHGFRKLQISKNHEIHKSWISMQNERPSLPRRVTPIFYQIVQYSAPRCG